MENSTNDKTINITEVVANGAKDYMDYIDIVSFDDFLNFADDKIIHDIVKNEYPEIYKQILLDNEV
ncbi:hypothetical protein SAMN04487944_101197 [Gracilibacillus ureilyticus]|uniref:Uncharacterized protein n=1 Tax=Gracilibacillus ureilyticus TaxID=531814 RepID=A0A1H9LCP8_9BACI|nr:hypothetical protein [Gracilibacillus ureilyticus]SER09140.1 hypothetical protein SAMN04487944_101197 [Gracilibacillus ureilyticus]